MLSLRRLSPGERLGLVRLGVALRSSTPRSDETVREYLERHRQSRRAQERLWDPIVIATLNTPPDRASAFLFSQVMKLAFLGGAEDSLLAFPRCGLSRLIEPAREFIERRGGSVLTGTAVTRIERTGEGYRIGMKERPPLHVRTVVSTLQQPMLRSLLGDDDMRSFPWLARPIPFSPIVSLYLWFDRELTEVPPFGAMIGTNVQWMFNRRAIAPPTTTPRFAGLLSCTISAAFAESAEQSERIVETAVRELRGAFPEIGNARLLDALVIKEKQATFTASPRIEQERPTPGGSGLPGFFVAGDWTATGLPGTIEGAVRSGFAAAVQVIGGSRGGRSA
jgi:zeta-carotene desaturase